MNRAEIPGNAGDVMEKKFLTPVEVSERYSGAIDVRTLANWRSVGKGPPFTKIGGKVLYQFDSLIEWEQARTVLPST